MSTPTASSSNPPKPTNSVLQNAATPQPHVTAFPSPVPRSVPSPATQRNQAGKSPFNASTHASSSGIMAHNHPTAGSSASASKALLGSSPANMAFNFESPNPMTLSLSNMGVLDSIGMGISMSGMGMGLSMTLGGSDQERTQRLEEVIALIKARPGRVSPEGLELLAARTGMDTMLDNRICTIAGGSVLVDVSFNANHRVKKVEVSYPTSSQVVKDNEKSASKILRDSLLVPPGMSDISLTLDKFAKNLDRLAQLDKLNGPPDADGQVSFNCFEAISGVYASLQKLFNHEKKAALIMLKHTHDVEEIAEREVMCKRSGLPMMNARGEIGLKLDYWMHRRRVRRRHPKSKNSFELEEDHVMNNAQLSDHPPAGQADIFSLSIECEESVPALYPPARVSNSWISDQINQPADSLDPPFGSALDWLDPPPTYLSKTANLRTNGLSSNVGMGKLPSIRFVAKLNPPLLLPLQTAISVLDLVGIPPESSTLSEQIGTFDGLLLSPFGVDAAVASQKESRTERVVLAQDVEGTEKFAKHSNSMFVPRSEYARYIREIPFEHPKQLVQLLPTLRQYAFFNSIIRKSFSRERALLAASAPVGRPLPVDMKLSGSARLSVIFPRLFTPGCVASIPASNLTLDELLLSTTASHDFTPDSTSRDCHQSCMSITVDILPNAEIAVVDQNLVSPDVTLSADLQVGEDIGRGPGNVECEAVKKLSDALDISGDIDIWVEWMRSSMRQ